MDSMFRQVFAIRCAAFAAALLTPAAGLAQAASPLRVYVTSITPAPLPILTADEHRQEITRAQNQIFETSARVRREYGDKRKTWPPEAWDKLNAAYDVHTLAVARANYERDETRELLANSVADIAREIGKSKFLALATSADQAELVLAVTGRRRADLPASEIYHPSYFVRFRLAPGPLADRASVLDAMRLYEWDRVTAKLIARPRTDAEFSDLEAGSNSGMKLAGELAAGRVELFAREKLGATKK